MKARYPGPCAGDCGGRIQPGDEIEHVPGEGHRHIECGEVERGQQKLLDPTPGRNERHCNSCYTIHAGECP